VTFLLLAILAATLNHLLFKAFPRLGVDLLSVIVVNYAVCIVIGQTFSGANFLDNAVYSEAWLPFSAIQGVLLIVCFVLIGKTTEHQGVVAASLATRLSVAIPTVAAFFLYGDSATIIKMIGILAALLALYLSCLEPGTGALSIRGMGTLPLALFAFFGLNSVLIKYVQQRFLDDATTHAYVMSAFWAAFIAGGAGWAWRRCRRGRSGRGRDLAAGLVLGITNYCAVYCLIRVLATAGWQSSRIFPTVSIAVVILSSLGARVLFKEALSRRSVAALAIGVVAIALINLGTAPR
jgi:drug/metabolite transporter (DMT)-like permease